MTRIDECRHAHWQGAIVTEDSPTCFMVALRIFNSDVNEAQQRAGGDDAQTTV